MIVITDNFYRNRPLAVFFTVESAQASEEYGTSRFEWLEKQVGDMKRWELWDEGGRPRHEYNAFEVADPEPVDL